MYKKNAPIYFLYISAPIKATEIVFIWEDRGDPIVRLNTKQTLSDTRLPRY